MLTSFTWPERLSLLTWCAFALYWKAASKHFSSPTVQESETRLSRGFHLLMVNLAFYLLVIPIPAFNLRFVPVSAAPQWTGLGVQLAAGCLAVWARRNLAHHWSGTIAIKADQHLIQTGPYKTVRHPIYTAMLGMFAGATLVNGRCQALLASGIICFAYWRKIHLEEAALAGAFGPSYDVYKARAGALFPRW